MLMELASQYRKPFLDFEPSAPIENRDFWERLDSALSLGLVEAANRLLPVSWSVIHAVDYLDFSRTGNRERYEEKQFSRRTTLNTLVLAECVENQGRFLDDIINGIVLICEESAWQLPAHHGCFRDAPQVRFPDIAHPIIDLFAAETGSVLATTAYLMKEKLDSVSPFLVEMVQNVLNHRIFTPYLNVHFWWMGDGFSHMINWTPWITQNVLLAAALFPLPSQQFRALFETACQSLDYFLEGYGEDGCCEEGAQYYRHAGLCLFGCLEILNEMTGGSFGVLYSCSKIRNMAAYIEHVHVDGPWYLNFADCSPIAGRCTAREFLFGKRTGNASLMQLAATDYRTAPDPLLSEEHNLYYRLLTLSVHREMTEFPADDIRQHDSDIFYPSVGLLIARDHCFCLAVKAGDNDDSHNHNDTGSFILYKDGKPMFVDIGVETYQKKTFSPQRYQIWTMQSQYHNLPTFLGEPPADREAAPYSYVDSFMNSGLTGSMQSNGPSFRARDTDCRFSPDCVEISMDIADAYPDTWVRSYYRHVQVRKGLDITITDTADCAPLQPVLSLITCEEPHWSAEASTLFLGALGICEITSDDKALSIITERLPITDRRLQTAWKQDLWRVLIRYEGTTLQLNIK
ncbi:MAG: heparinase II/III-family protein [Clostridiales bacterium]|nr:heparinase II/III-family protein [Clostridiales bacterium]